MGFYDSEIEHHDNNEQTTAVYRFDSGNARDRIVDEQQIDHIERRLPTVAFATNETKRKREKHCCV